MASLDGMTDIKVLQEAFQLLGWSLKHESTCRTWSSNPDKTKVYPWVAVNPEIDGYDVGILPNEAGLKLEADLFAHGKIEKQLGKDYVRLKDYYSLAHLRQQSTARNWRVTHKEVDDHLEVEVEG